MGQEFLNPPSVEGWHTGAEWINSGSLMRRTNFVVDTMSDTERPGVAAMVERIRQHGELSPERLVEVCLDMMGPVEVDDATRGELGRTCIRPGSGQVERRRHKRRVRQPGDRDAAAHRLPARLPVRLAPLRLAQATGYYLTSRRCKRMEAMGISTALRPST